MNEKYLVTVNDKTVTLKEFINITALPEIINSLKLDFNTDNPEGVNIFYLLIVLLTLVEKIKNKSEYTLLIENLVNCLVVIRKMEMDAGLGDDRF